MNMLTPTTGGLFMGRLSLEPLRKSILVFFSLLLALGASSAFAAPGLSKQAPPPNTANLQGWLTKEVRHQLVMLPYYTVFDNLEFKVDGAKVILIGQVVRGDVKN